MNKDWMLTDFRYEGKDGFYQPEEVLYFVNIPLETDHEGLSDVEPVVDACRARHEFLGENWPEIIRTIWAPCVILKTHTEGLSKEETDRVVDDLAEVALSISSLWDLTVR